MVATLSALAATLAEYGLIPRGAFHPEAKDGVPALADGAPAATLVPIGHAGPAMWAAFARARRDEPDPLDAWSRRVLGAVAETFGAAALFPFDGPPYSPFQRWATRAEPVHPSPLGIFIHPDYGLWHGYRGALAFPGRLDREPADTQPAPCVTCADKPCLAACPVGAFTGAEYRVEDCVAHLAAPEGENCMSGGCLARRACPVGLDYAYGPEQTAFHMDAFRRSRSNGS
ncbi:MAG: hypothetical protein ACTSXZ_01270 [Alphaproteobacteria bacterium]